MDEFTNVNWMRGVGHHCENQVTVCYTYSNFLKLRLLEEENADEQVYL